MESDKIIILSNDISKEKDNKDDVDNKEMDIDHKTKDYFKKNSTFKGNQDSAPLDLGDNSINKINNENIQELNTVLNNINYNTVNIDNRDIEIVNENSMNNILKGDFYKTNVSNNLGNIKYNLINPSIIYNPYEDNQNQNMNLGIPGNNNLNQKDKIEENLKKDDFHQPDTLDIRCENINDNQKKPQENKNDHMVPLEMHQLNEVKNKIRNKSICRLIVFFVVIMITFLPFPVIYFDNRISLSNSTNKFSLSSNVFKLLSNFEINCQDKVLVSLVLRLSSSRSSEFYYDYHCKENPYLSNHNNITKDNNTININFNDRKYTINTDYTDIGVNEKTDVHYLDRQTVKCYNNDPIISFKLNFDEKRRKINYTVECYDFNFEIFKNKYIFEDEKFICEKKFSKKVVGKYDLKTLTNILIGDKDSHYINKFKLFSIYSPYFYYYYEYVEC